MMFGVFVQLCLSSGLNVDDFSRVTWLYLMKRSSELFSHFSAFCTEIQTQFHVSV